MGGTLAGMRRSLLAALTAATALTCGCAHASTTAATPAARTAASVAPSTLPATPAPTGSPHASVAASAPATPRVTRTLAVTSLQATSSRPQPRPSATRRQATAAPRRTAVRRRTSTPRASKPARTAATAKPVTFAAPTFTFVPGSETCAKSTHMVTYKVTGIASGSGWTFLFPAPATRAGNTGTFKMRVSAGSYFYDSIDILRTRDRKGVHVPIMDLTSEAGWKPC